MDTATLAAFPVRCEVCTAAPRDDGGAVMITQYRRYGLDGSEYEPMPKFV